jgi:putative ABC transport system substrate-binding protein
MADLGYVEGQSYVVEPRWVQSADDDYALLAEALVASGVDVIVTTALRATQAAHQATTTIPVVMVIGNDPVGAGIVASLARPGGNVTGLASRSADLDGKRLELLEELVVPATRVAVLVDARAPDKTADVSQSEAAARTLGLELRFLEISSADELDGAFGLARDWSAAGLLVLDADLTFANRRQIAERATSAGLVAIYPHRLFAMAGGLMSYGPSTPRLFRRAATYVDKILKGTLPADLPVEQANVFDLVINRKTAQALGVTIPVRLLTAATEVLD